MRRILEQRQPNTQIETMREALTVWNPFADELLTLWCETTDGGRIGAVTPDDWLPRAVKLLVRYQHLAAEHTLCSKPSAPRSLRRPASTCRCRAVRGGRCSISQGYLAQSSVSAARFPDRSSAAPSATFIHARSKAALS
ncbi:hypothetical protein [Micromonospora sp. WMMD812]|uniref:hypothetical protein n=1 Tax=Micromonospora sp. WMMD812 TaxID=3015152 RepID=UPI00248C0472|nr:hypothetical protein [Micromonospora sp. WMMD812]WBB69073.1 hypothetical protein O7603_06900 [Micromonospora sp. WMMD812]